MLVGFSSETTLVKSLITENRFPHATILNGTASIGKELFAREIAKHLLFAVLSSRKENHSLEGLTYEGIQKNIDANTYPDLITVTEAEDKNGIGVSQTRELLQRLSLESYYPLGAVAIIKNAHLLTRSASNALLKTLEEPESGKFIILTSSKLQLIPDTIQSRCQIIHCRNLSTEEIKSILLGLSNPSIDNKLAIACAELLVGSLADLNLYRVKKDKENTRKLDLDALTHHLSSFVKEATALDSRITRILSSHHKADITSDLIQFLRNQQQNKNGFFQETKALAEKIAKKSVLLASCTQDKRHKKLLTSITFGISKAVEDSAERNLDFELALAGQILSGT